MLRWIFFDVGNVLFNDAPQDFEAFRFFHRAIQQVAPEQSFQDLLQQREELARTGANLVLAKIASRYLDPSQIKAAYAQARQHIFSRYEQFNLTNDGLTEVLQSLSQNFRLGIIANQPPECRSTLSARKLLERFEIVAISEEIGLHKPNPEIFHWAIENAGASPKECLMIGDRYDNDIAPAQRLGMKTLWLNWPGHRHKNWFPTDPLAKAFLASTDRVPYYNAKPDPNDPMPDVTVSNLKQIPNGIQQIMDL